MALINDRDRDTLTNQFKALAAPVDFIVFVDPTGCQYCTETRQIAEELASLSDLLSVEVYMTGSDQAAAYNIDKAPAIVLMRGGSQPKDYGIRYYGIPSGYEFSTLIQDVMMISAGESGLADATKTAIAALTQPLHFQVFVTPTCPYCPGAVHLAHQMAMESDLITADMVEATEFPDLSMRYQVRGVPRTVVNDEVHIEGMAPEQVLLQKLHVVMQ